MMIPSAESLPQRPRLGKSEDLDGEDLRPRPGEDDGEAELPDEHRRHQDTNRRPIPGIKSG